MSDGYLRRELHREANRVLIDAEYTGRQHMLYARWWRSWAVFMGLPSTIFAVAASSGAALSAIVGLEAWVTALLALLGAMAGAIRQFFQPDEQAVRHGAKGAECIAIRNEARRFMKIELRSQLSLDALTHRVQTLASRYDALRSQGPTDLPAWTYKQVKAELAAGNYSYENDQLWSEYEGLEQKRE